MPRFPRRHQPPREPPAAEVALLDLDTRMLLQEDGQYLRVLGFHVRQHACQCIVYVEHGRVPCVYVVLPEGPQTMVTLWTGAASARSKYADEHGIAVFRDVTAGAMSLVFHGSEAESATEEELVRTEWILLP